MTRSGAVRMGVGLLIVVCAALLLLADVIESGVAGMVGIIGIGVIASSGYPGRSAID